MNTRKTQAQSTLSTALTSQNPAKEFDQIIKFTLEQYNLEPYEAAGEDSIWTIVLNNMLTTMQKSGLTQGGLYDFIKRFAALAMAYGKDDIFENNILWNQSRATFVQEATSRGQLAKLMSFDPERKIFNLSEVKHYAFWKQVGGYDSTHTLAPASENKKPRTNTKE